MNPYDEDLGFRNEYVLRRLVFVNSSQSAYISLPIDISAGLFGTNNAGKSSSLRAVKFFLLPEVNLNDMARKFAFRGPLGDYGAAESFKHYFGSNRSFIVCEGENPAGPYCQILHQGREEFSYSRIFVAAPYAEIAHLFWNPESDANNGMGEPTNHTHQEVWEILKPMRAVRINSKSALKEALYSRYNPANLDTRFCMVPMPGKASDAQIETLRATLNLAFDFRQSRLPMAIATLIDQDLSGGDTSIKIDLARISEEYEELRTQDDHLRQLRRLQPTWNTLSELHHEFKALYSQTRETLFGALSAASVHVEKAQAKIALLEPRRTEIETAFSDAKKAKGSSKNQLVSTKAILGEREQRHFDLDEKKHKCIELRTKYISLGLTDDEQIIEYLKSAENDGLHALQERIEHVRDGEKLRRRLEERNKDLATAKESLEALESHMSSDSERTLDQVSEHAAVILQSLNENLSQLRVEIDPDEYVLIDKFVSLFSNVDDCLTFKGEPIVGVPIRKYLQAEADKDNQLRLEALRKDVAEYLAEIRSGSDILKTDASARHKLLEKLEAELVEVESEISVLRSADTVLRNYAESESSIEEARQLVKESQLDNDTSDKRFLAASSERDNFRAEYEHQQDITQKSQQVLRDLEREFTTAGGLLGVKRIPDSLNDIESLPSTDQLLEVAEEAKKNVSRLQQINLEAECVLVELTQANIRDAEAVVSKHLNMASTDFQRSYDAYASEFRNIDELERKWRADVATHNHTTSTQMGVLQKMERSVKNFSASINKELENVRISNIERTWVKLETDSRFQSLCKDLRKYESSTTTDSMLSPEFYNRLQGFCDEFLATRAGQAKLDMTKIVVGVDYDFEINGQHTRIAQSNGTTAMLNAVMLSILIKRIVPEDVAVTLPIIFDEVTSLDSRNAKELVAAVESRGLVLFAACPENTAYIAKAIGNHHSLSLHRLVDSPPIGQCVAIYIDNVDQLVQVGTPNEVSSAS